MKTLLGIATLLLLAGCGPDPAQESVHAFYYGWYANEETDGAPRHWNHEVLGVDEPASFPGGDDIGADFYPALGTYSSNDGQVIDRHMEQCVAAGIDVLVVSWWGRDSFEDRNLELLMDAAAKYGVGIAIHLEPIPGRDAAVSREALVYLLDRYGDHPALHRPAHSGGRPYVYIYDSYLSPSSEWARLLRPEGDLTVRGTEYDIFAIGLWVQEDEGAYFTEGGFDGFYTYFASDGFTFGSSTRNWPTLFAFATGHDLDFIPCVGPGYIDTRIRPWNAATTRDREDGAYYDRMFQAALAAGPMVIGITSFNEWHEGTQIEPAVPKSVGEYSYEDYTPLEPDHYLKRTRFWADEFKGRR